MSSKRRLKKILTISNVKCKFRDKVKINEKRFSCSIAGSRGRHEESQETGYLQVNDFCDKKEVT